MRGLLRFVAACLPAAFVATALPGATAGAQPVASPAGYAVALASGKVATFGGAGFEGDFTTEGVSAGNDPVVALAPSPDGHGYWLASADGTVRAFGDAKSPLGPWPGNGHGVVALVPDQATAGYWLVGATGAVRAVGAPSLGATNATSSPVVAAVAAGPAGLWLATADGTVRAIGPSVLPAPAHPPDAGVVAMATSPSGLGYWLVNRRGRVVAAGDARTFGSSRQPAQAVRSIVPTPDGGGYLLVHRDGVIEAFGDARKVGDVSTPLHPPLYPAFYSAPTPQVAGAAYLAPGTSRAESGPPRITFVGDSLSVLAAQDTARYLSAHHDPALVTNGGIQGCGVSGSLYVATTPNPGPPKATLPACADWFEQYTQEIDTSHPDVVAVLVGYWECQEHSIFGSAFNLATSADYRVYVAAALSSVVDLARAAGARVLLLNAPYFGDGTADSLVDLYNGIVSQVAAQQGVPLFDLHAVLDPGGHYRASIDGTSVRMTDGVHVTPAGVETFVDPALVPEMESLAASDRFSGPAP